MSIPPLDIPQLHVAALSRRHPIHRGACKLRARSRELVPWRRCMRPKKLPALRGAAGGIRRNSGAASEG
jgi:hypothetical protein